MDEKFQDRIDDYLLNRMTDVEKKVFLHEIEQDADKKGQLEFTRNVKDSIRSREEKLNALAQFRQQYEEERRPAVSASPIATEPVKSKKQIWLWISGVAAVFVAGFFAIRPMVMYESSPYYDSTPMEIMRGEDDVFSPAPADSTNNDTIGHKSGKEEILDE